MNVLWGRGGEQHLRSSGEFTPPIQVQRPHGTWTSRLRHRSVQDEPRKTRTRQSRRQCATTTGRTCIGSALSELHRPRALWCAQCHLGAAGVLQLLRSRARPCSVSANVIPYGRWRYCPERSSLDRYGEHPGAGPARQPRVEDSRRLHLLQLRTAAAGKPGGSEGGGHIAPTHLSDTVAYFSSTRRPSGAPAVRRTQRNSGHGRHSQPAFSSRARSLRVRGPSCPRPGSAGIAVAGDRSHVQPMPSVRST